jgi:hypothetical protein
MKTVRGAETEEEKDGEAKRVEGAWLHDYDYDCDWLWLSY